MPKVLRRDSLPNTITETKTDRPQIQTIHETNQPKPNYSSYVTRNHDLILQRTVNNRRYVNARSAALVPANIMNTQLQTQDDKSMDLKKAENKELIAILGADYSDQFKSPYDTVDLIRFHEALRDDGIVAASIDFLIQFMLGDHPKTVIDINSEFNTEEDAKAARDAFSNNPRIQAYKRKIDQINRELKFQIHMFSLLIQCMTFGRACGLVEYSDIDQMPIAIKVLPAMHLGQVYVHRKTWALLGVEHLDFKFPESIIKAEDMIYFANRNHNISPGTFQYGYSIVERIVDLSELNRITNQRNLKEINYRLWAAFLLVKIPGSFNEELMKQLTEDLAKGAGNSIAINQAAEVEVHQIGHDMDKLLDQRDKNYREEIRQLQVPVILFDPDILNRATSQELMEAWTVSVLKGYRSWLADIIQDQWLNPIIKKMIENERDAAREGTEDTQQAEEEPPAKDRLTLSQSKTEAGDKGKQEVQDESESGSNPNLVPSITKEIIPIEAIDPTSGEVLVYRLPWKIKLEFEALNYDTFKEKVESSILLKNNGLATTATALKRIGVTDENEIAQLLEMEEERRIQNEQLAAAQIAKQQSGERSPGALPQGEGQAGAQAQQAQQQKGGAKPRTLERQRQKMREELRQSVSGNNTPTNRKGNIIGGRKKSFPSK